MPLINTIVNIINYNRLSQIEYFKKNPIEIQEKMFLNLINKGSKTKFGEEYNFTKIKSLEQFASNVPVFDYDKFKPYVERVLAGEQNLLWNTEIKWFAKSSGTTADRSKFIPISKESLDECHFRSGKDIYLMYIDKYPDTKIFIGKTLAIGGSTDINVNDYNNNSYYGDLSAVLIKNLPFWTHFSRIPNQEISLLEKWDEKIDKIIKTSYNKNVTNLVGVPSWLLVMLKQLLDYTGKSNILEIWPNLELFIHGGVSFTPYRNIYKELIPSNSMNYLETYNASEGFFGIQDEFKEGKSDMLLMLDYGIYYEFIELTDYLNNKLDAIPLAGVKTDTNYVMIITTNGGLWRYVIGDTVCFTSTNPYKIKITGRTKHFINAFGEEVIIDNAQQAISYASEITKAVVREYTAAPTFEKEGSQGAHEWLFEFITPPNNLEKFTELLDNKLREINSDYDAKRYNNMTLGSPIIHVSKDGLFYKWLNSKGKLGGQNKIPQLSNTREYIEELLKINN